MRTVIKSNKQKQGNSAISTMAFLVLVFLTSFNLYANPVNGWEIYKNYSILYMDDRRVFDTRDKILEIPPYMDEANKTDFILYAGEHFLGTDDKENLANLIITARKSGNYSAFAEAILSALWRLKKKDQKGAVQKLESYITVETSEYRKTLALGFLHEISGNENARKDALLQIKKTSCDRKEPYYPLCRLLKLNYIAEELLKPDLPNLQKTYANADRLLAPYFDESDSMRSYLLSSISLGLAKKLAQAGFAYEAAHFQYLQALSQKRTGNFDVFTLEQLAFYQMATGNYAKAEETLQYLLKNLPAKSSSYKNNILFKAGILSYLRKNFKTSLEYMTAIDFAKWNKRISHPFTGAPMTLLQAKDIISAMIWKQKGAVKAVRALKSIKMKKPTEDDMFLKLRTAQILFQDKPDLSEKLTDEIIYLSQGKGWKKAEYLATLLHGYIHIVNKNYRKATIQFTKSSGIPEENSTYGSGWMRVSGMVNAYMAAGEPAPVQKYIQSGLKYFGSSPESDDLLFLSHYLDLRFDTEAFITKSAAYYESSGNRMKLLELLHHATRAESNMRKNIKSGSLQVRETEKRLSDLPGLAVAGEGMNFNSKLTQNRKKYSGDIAENSDLFDESAVLESKNPIIAVITFQKYIHVFFYNPEMQSGQKWKYSKKEYSVYRSSDYYSLLTEFADSVSKMQTLQIYFNENGWDVYRHLRKKIDKLNLSFFYNFQKMKPVDGTDFHTSAFRTAYADKTDLPGLDSFSSEDYFMGYKIPGQNNRLMIWDFNAYKKGENYGLMNTFWKTKTGEVLEFRKFFRRMDHRTTPLGIVFTQNALIKSFWENFSQDITDLSGYWFLNGTQYIYLTETDIYSNTKGQGNLLQLTKKIPKTPDLIWNQLTDFRQKGINIALITSGIR